MDAHGRPSQGLWTTHAHLWKFIGHHDDGIADLELGMADSAVGLRDAHPFGSGKGLLVNSIACDAPFAHRYGVTEWYPSGIGLTVMGRTSFETFSQPNILKLRRHRLCAAAEGLLSG
jgi:hypothetical protein